MGSQQSLYSRLDPASSEIRLVHIQPGAWDDPILCEMEVVSLDSSPSPIYETLSYAWGDSHVTGPILLEDCVVDVKANLWAALRRLRCASKARMIWIDAICINQNDIPERNQQVMLMGKIYSRCRGVMMWLEDSVGGNTVDTFTIEEGAKPSAAGISTPERSQVYDAFIVIHLLAVDSHFNDRPFFYQFKGSRATETPAAARFRKAWKVLGSIMKLPYWDRIWIVQENILPPSATVVLGSITISWFHFSKASKALMKHSTTCCHFELAKILPETASTFTLFNRIVSGMDQLRKFKELNLPPLDLAHLLPLFFHRKATDPRDKVYGILSLIEGWSNEIWKNETGRSIVPDYSPANSPRRMFLNVTMYLLEETKNLKILTGHCRHRHEPDFPSWIVDWGLEPDVDKWDIDRLRMQMYELYSAASDVPFVAKLLSNEGLKVQALFVDEVSAVGPYISSSNWDSSFPTLDSVLQLGGKKRLATDEYMGGRTWADAHWRTICGNLIEEDEEFRKARPEDEEDLKGSAIAHITVTGALSERRVFITKDGYLGLGPEGLRIGDHVFILSGSNVPFALRALDKKKTGEFQTQYQLVGDCYVHGIMNGEMYENPWFEDPRYLVLR
jgi:hypothetical protein